MNLNGPAALTKEERRLNCQEIVARLLVRYKERIVASALYGSMSRGTDGPYSDIEMFCVLAGVTVPAASTG